MQTTPPRISPRPQEIVLWLTGARPLKTRTQAGMVGRFYWYSYERAAWELGYEPMPAQRALAEAIEWLVASPHISPLLRATLNVNLQTT